MAKCRHKSPNGCKCAPTPTRANCSAKCARKQSKALRPFSLNASQGTLSRSPTPSRGPPRRSSKSDTTRISVTTRRLENCSGWFSSVDPRIYFDPAHREIDQSIGRTHKSREGSRWVGSSTMSVARLLTRSQLIAVHCTHSTQQRKSELSRSSPVVALASAAAIAPGAAGLHVRERPEKCTTRRHRGRTQALRSCFSVRETKVLVRTGCPPLESCSCACRLFVFVVGRYGADA